MPSSQLPGNPDVPLVPVASSDCNFVSILFSTAQILAGATVGQSYNSPHDNRLNDSPLHDTGILVDEFFHRTEEFTVSDCIDPALLMLNPANTFSIGNQEVFEAGGVVELGRGSNHSGEYQYGHQEDGQPDLSPGPDTLPAMLPAQRAYPTPPSESPPYNPLTSHPSYDASPATELFAPFPWGDGNHSRPDQGNGMSTEATRTSQATPQTRNRRAATTPRIASSSQALEMCEQGPPYSSRQYGAHTLSSVPTALAFPASEMDAQTIAMPEFVEGSSSGAPAAHAPRSSKAGPSRTEKTKKAARASKSGPSKAKKTGKAVRLTAASPYGAPEDAFRMTEPRAPNPHQDPTLNTFTLPAIPGFLPSGNDSNVQNMPEFVQGSSRGAAAANAPRSSKAGPSRTQKSTKATRKSKAKNTAKAVRLTSTNPYGVPEDAFGMPEPRAPTASHQDHRPTTFALPAVPDFPAPWNDARANVLPDFIEGSSGGAPTNARASEAGPSRTERTTKTTRVSKARPSKAKNTTKAAPQAAAPEAPRLYCDYAGCSVSCKNSNELRRHRVGCPRGPDGGASARANCPYCDLTYSRFDAMQRHCIKDHPGSVVPIKERERGKGKKK